MVGGIFLTLGFMLGWWAKGKWTNKSVIRLTKENKGD
jgi:hypothetical protein